MRTIPAPQVIDTSPATPATPATSNADPQPPPPPRRPDWPGAAIMADPIGAGVLLSIWSGDAGVLAPAPPGSGKTTLVARLAGTLAARADMRVGIAAQTREQAAEITRRLGALGCAARLIWPTGTPAPDLGTDSPAQIVQGRNAHYATAGGGVLVATTARWLFADPATLGCDVMLVDEAWQATYGDIGALGAFAAQLVCVGDPGQIDPVVTGPTSRWADTPTGPHRPAPQALQAAHGAALSVVTLRHTWRLGPLTTSLIQPVFYPDLPFTSRRPPETLTSHDGSLLPEITRHDVTATGGPGDPTFMHTCADLTRDLLTTTLTTAGGARPITPADLAVVTAHVHQAAAVRAILADLPDVLVGTANQLQGMERPAAVVLHPLAGYRDPNGFGTDLGRACVMLSRHRAHLRVITDTATPDVLNAPNLDPAAATHQRLLEALTDA